MNKSLAVFFALVLGGLAVAQSGSVALLDERYGFRDLKFEQSITATKDMVLLEDAGDMKFYTRKDDPLALSGAKLKKIEYAFYKGRLANVTITAAGDADAAALLNVLEADYGAGRPSPRNPQKRYWFGKKVTMDYMPSPTGPTSVAMWSKSLQSLEQAEKQTRANANR